MSDRPVWFTMASALAGGWRDQAFLDRSWIAPLLARTPEARRERLALELLSLSPHYFCYQHTDRYRSLSRAEVLRAERDRLRASRAQIVRSLVLEHATPADVVLDFGCGPGFLSHALSPYVARIVATDVSRGAISCAKVINSQPNIQYRVNPPEGGLEAPAGTFNLVCSFAVFQHLAKDRALRVLQEMGRAMRQSAKAIIHLPVGQQQPLCEPGAGLRSRYSLRYGFYSEAEISTMASMAGLSISSLVTTSSLAEIDDDIGQDFIALLAKPG